MRIVLAVVLVACGGNAPPPAPAPPPPRDAGPHPIAIESAASTRFDPLLGAPCATPLGGRGVCAICDRHDRIVALVMPGDFLRVPGAERSGVVGASAHRLEYAIAVGQGSLRAQVLTCPGCERQIGWALLAATDALPDLDPDARGAIQAACGWPASPLLDEAGLRATPAHAPARQPPPCTTPR